MKEEWGLAEISNLGESFMSDGYDIAQYNRPSKKQTTQPLPPVEGGWMWSGIILLIALCFILYTLIFHLPKCAASETSNSGTALILFDQDGGALIMKDQEGIYVEKKEIPFGFTAEFHGQEVFFRMLRIEGKLVILDLVFPDIRKNEDGQIQILQ